jgi:hypothetical protein
MALFGRAYRVQPESAPFSSPPTRPPDIHTQTYSDDIIGITIKGVKPYVIKNTSKLNGLPMIGDDLIAVNGETILDNKNPHKKAVELIRVTKPKTNRPINITFKSYVHAPGKINPEEPRVYKSTGDTKLLGGRRKTHRKKKRKTRTRRNGSTKN